MGPSKSVKESYKIRLFSLSLPVSDVKEFKQRMVRWLTDEVC